MKKHLMTGLNAVDPIDSAVQAATGFEHPVRVMFDTEIVIEDISPSPIV